jgi:hypothetical protein
MQNLKKLEKSRGAVVFAFNTAVDYVAIADRTSRLIAHNLQLPVTLITDADADPKFSYDKIIRINNDPTSENQRVGTDHTVTEWRNFGRYLAYELSPYDETILLDTDYLVLDKSLLTLLETDFDYRLMHHNRTPKGADYEMMGPTGLPFVWATVVLFRKTEKSRLFFNLVGRIQSHYHYYRLLYNIQDRNFRNDFAFAIANTIINGYTLNESQSIPWPMFTIDEKIVDIRADGHILRVYHADHATIVPYQNTHIMDKEYLQSKNFERMIGIICDAT